MGETVIIVLVILLAIAIAAAFYFRTRSRRLRARFGPEYDRAVEETGNKYRAEAKLEKLQKQVDKLPLRPLLSEETRRYREAWIAVQSEFVDDPSAAIAAADRLLGEVMSALGYPVAEFEERADEISVNHPLVVEHYRAGHDIALKHADGKASTEDLRHAMLHYRTLFNDLIGATPKVRVSAAGGAM